MNWLDLVILSTVGIRSWSGYRRGLVRQVFDLIGLVVGLALAVQNYYLFQWRLAHYVRLPLPVLAVLAFLLILFAAMVVARILGEVSSQVFALPGLAWLNSCTGAVVGALVGVIAIVFVLGVIQIFAFPLVELALSDSILAPYLDQVMPQLMAAVEDYIPWTESPGSVVPTNPLPSDGRSL